MERKKKMNKFLLILFFLNCITGEKEVYEVKKIEPLNFKFCFKNLSDSNKFFKTENLTQIKNCDFFIFTEIEPKFEKEILELYKEESILKKSEFNCEKIFVQKEDFRDIRKISFICYKESKITNMNFEVYKDFDFLNPVFLFAFDLINERKIMFVNFDSDKFRKNELKEFDKLLSFVSQNYSYRKTFYFGKFHLKEKILTDSFLNSLSFPFILKNLNKEESDTKIYTDNFGIKTCNSKKENLSGIEYYSTTCEL